MKEINEQEVIKMDNGIEVRPYLTYSQIEAIVSQVVRFDTWSERESTIDIMILHMATNLGDKEIEKIGHDMFVKSGVMDQVKNNIKNYYRIQEAINYTQSTSRALLQIAKEVPSMLEPLKEVTQKYASRKE